MMDRVKPRPTCILKLFSVILASYSSTIFAQSDYSYLMLEAGASFSGNPHLTAPAPWDPSPQGYNKKFKNSEILGAGLGYYFCPSLATEVLVNHRNSFKYSQYQNSTTPLGAKIRFFNFKNTNVLVNFIGYGQGISDSLCCQINDYRIDPFANIGLGVSYNTIDNFRSQRILGGTIFSIMQAYTQISFAYQFGAGLEFTTCDFLKFTLGYRYLNTGRFKTNYYLVDNPDNPGTTSGVSQPAWFGKFRANELYVNLKFCF